MQDEYTEIEGCLPRRMSTFDMLMSSRGVENIATHMANCFLAFRPICPDEAPTLLFFVLPRVAVSDAVYLSL